MVLLINEQNLKQIVLNDSIVYHHHGNSDDFEDRFMLENNTEYLFVFYAHGVSNDLIVHVRYSYNNTIIYENNVTEKPRHAGGTLALYSFNFEANQSAECLIDITVERSDRWHLTVYNDPPLENVAFFEEDSYTIMIILLTLIGGFVLLMITLFIEMNRS